MKINYILFIPILFFVATTNAQFTDDMESYIEGEPIIGAHWTDAGCGGGVGCALMSSSTQAYSGNLSGFIPGDGTTRAVLDYGNKIFGDWCTEFWLYIPIDKEAYFVIQQEVPANGTIPFAHTFFNQGLNNSGVGKVEDTALGTVIFNFPHNEWFRISIHIDITLGIGVSTWELYIDNDEVIPSGTPFTNENGEYPITWGGIEFLSVSSNNNLFIDDIIYQDSCYFANSDVNQLPKFVLFPNPTEERIQISSQETIKSLSIYNVLGYIVKETSGLKSVDISNLSSGIYFIEVSTDTGRSIQKFIKN